MNILLNGINGYMGGEVVKLAAMGYRNTNILIGVDITADGTEAPLAVKSVKEIDSVSEIDCIIDFSHHSTAPELLAFAKANKLPVVLATTGHTEQELKEIRDASRYIPVFFSANMSLGVALLVELAKKTAAAMPDAEIEIIEKHHSRKLDAPSGTALMIANALTEVRGDAYVNTGRCGNGKRSKEEIGIHAVRMGNIVGVHEVIVGTQNQTITLKHEAHSRALFAEGAISAAEFLVGCEAGLYDMKSLISGEKKKDAALSVN